jgi:hypothetical protein
METSKATRQIDQDLPDLILSKDGPETLERTDMPRVPFAAFPPIERGRTGSERDGALKHEIVDSRHPVQLVSRVGKSFEVGVKKPVARGLSLEDTHGPSCAALMKSDKGPSERVLPEKPFVSITW